MSNYPQAGYPAGNPAPGYPQGGYPPERRSGCGGCLGKFLIFFGVIFVLLIAMCCGGGFYLKSFLESSITQQPAEVQAISDEIISIHVPPPLEPVGGGRFKVPITGKTLGQGAVFSDKDHKCTLVIGSFGEMFGPQFQDQMRQALEKSQNQNGSGGDNDKSEKLKDEKTSKLEPTIQGEKAVFNISEGIGEKSNKAKIRIQGTFKGKTGPAIFFLEADAETLPRAKVDEMIDSMQ